MFAAIETAIDANPAFPFAEHAATTQLENGSAQFRAGLRQRR